MDTSNGKVVKGQGQDLAIYTPESDDEILLTSDERVYPRLTLIQATSDIEGPKGYFQNSMTGEVKEKVRCAILRNSLGRIMFDPDRSKKRTICGSEDRLVPSDRFIPDGEMPINSNCLECPFEARDYSETVTVGGKDEEKTCLKTIGLYCVDLDDSMPFIFSVKRTGITPVVNLLTPLQFKKKRDGLRLFNYEVTISSKFMEKRGNKWHIPVFNITNVNKEADFGALLKQSMNAVPDMATAEQPEPMMDEGV